VLFNASDEAHTLTLPDTRGRHFKLDEVQRKSHDEILNESRFVRKQGAFFVPARTTAVFVDK
jgi:hypothetical protein